MAKAEMVMTIKTEYRIVLFPFAERVQVGDAVLVKAFGVPVYRRAGSVKSLFGVVWGKPEHG